MENGELLYHTDNLGLTEDGEMTVGAAAKSEAGAAEGIGALDSGGIDRYRVQEIGGSSYFISHGTIDAYGWDYYCLVSCEKIGQQIRRIRTLCLWES